MHPTHLHIAPPSHFQFTQQPGGWIAVNPGHAVNHWQQRPPSRPPGLPPPPVSPVVSEDPTVCAFWSNRLAPMAGRMSSRNLLRTPPTVGEPISPPAPPSAGPTSPKSPKSPISPRNRNREKTARALRAKALEEALSPDSSENAPISPITVNKGAHDLPISSPSDKPLDKYAHVFVQQYLKDIQKLPHAFDPLPPLSVFPSPQYPRDLFPLSLVDRIKEMFDPTLLTIPPPSRLPPNSLCAEHYLEHWNTLLSWELDQVAKDKQDIVLWKMFISIVDWKLSHFSVFVPGIRENHPHLEPGDVLHMREVLVEAQQGTGRAFEGRIISLIKREGIIHFSSPTLRAHIQMHIPPVPGNPLENNLPTFGSKDHIPLHFNFSFLANPGPSLTMNLAIMTMSTRVVNIPNLTAQQWLFPEPLHFDKSMPTLIPREGPDVWVDNGLNPEQKAAVHVASAYRSPVPFIVRGPPGTGKTRTVVEMVHQILRVQPHAHILVCAPSNSATDTLASRLSKVLGPGQLFRLNDEKRTFAEVPVGLLQYCHVENNQFALPTWPILMAYRVIVTSCLDAGILSRAYATNTCIGMLEDRTMNILHPTCPRCVEPHWSHLLIDEAAQGSEPELLVPITVALPYTPPPGGVAIIGRAPQLVLCGDPNQLGPIVHSDRARDYELDISLLERLINRPLYDRYLKDPSFGLGFVRPFVNLVKNYRSHPAILMPPSAIFYEDTLEPCATANGIVSWKSGLSNAKIPLKFIGGDFKEECIDERSTWFNEGEIAHVVSTIRGLMKESESSVPPLHLEEIGVMAPWREQVWKLRERLRWHGLGKVDVGTVEDYQGREMRIVILSCVRSNKRFLRDDGEKGQGLIFEKKRMNVAITRAKELLVVIGNGNVLKIDPYWKNFLQFANRNGLYVGPDLELEMDGSYISRLESRLMAHYRGITLTDEDEGVMLAGGIARELLRDV